ncbi:MAG: recombination protein RecR [Gemmatimonadetes bacterium]|nr:recombination protein RecR [Gemmatimonadota bacterium]
MSVIDELTTELARLPGIGRKTALRLTYHLLKRPPDEIRRLARSLDDVAERVRACSCCGNLTEQDPCALCTSPRRDASSICVVEEASDIMAIERTGEYGGMYHVLGGRLSPLDGIGPEELNVATLLRRVGTATVTVAAAVHGTQDVRSPEAMRGAEGVRSAEDMGGAENGSTVVQEVIVATNPSVEGEATALYLQRVLQPLGVRVTRLARGLPVGGDLEYADGVTIAQAFAGRREIQGEVR